MAKRGENIHKRKDGRWEGRYIKGRTAEGKPLWGYVYGHNYAEVKSVLTQNKALSGLYQLSNKSMLFSELAELWLTSLAHSVKESTLAHYRYTLHKYLLPVFGGLQVCALDDTTLERLFLQVLSPEDESHKPLGTSSAQECLGILRRICKYAVHLHLMQSVEICVKLPRARKSEPQPLTQIEQNTLKAFLLQSPTSRKIGLLLQMMLGLRIGEVCGLQWGDFDLDAEILTVRRIVCRICCGDGHTKIVVQPPKTQSSFREIPLPKQLVSILKRLRKSFSKTTWFLSCNEVKPVEPRCYRKSIQCYLKQASLRKIHPHTLRHTFATTCLQSGCDIKTLSELLGHANANVTLQRYVHSNLTWKRKEMQRIYNLLEKSCKESMKGKVKEKTT